MRLEFEFFGSLQDRMGGRTMQVEADIAPTTIDGLMGLVTQSARDRAALQAPHIRLAVNDRIIARDSLPDMRDGDRIAVMSPFSGG